MNLNEEKSSIVAIILIAVSVLSIFSFIGFFIESWIIMLLWNWIVPFVMWCQPLTYWHAVGFNLLISLLFGGNGIGTFFSKILDIFIED